MLIVKEIIKQKGYTMEDVAKKMEIKRESLSRAINGNPTLDTLKKIADALNVSVPELFAPQSGSDFTALIDNKGELKRFDSAEELKRFLEKIS